MSQCHHSHFGSRYKLGCCGHAGLLRALVGLFARSPASALVRRRTRFGCSCECDDIVAFACTSAMCAIMLSSGRGNHHRCNSNIMQLLQSKVETKTRLARGAGTPRVRMDASTCSRAGAAICADMPLCSTSAIQFHCLAVRLCYPEGCAAPSDVQC